MTKMVTRLPKGISESEFQRAVLLAAYHNQWKAAHFSRARMPSMRWATPVAADGAGFPDLVLIHPGAGRLIVAELKSAGGRPTPAQVAWLEWFRAAGVPAYLWRPADWPAIVAVLTISDRREECSC